MSMRMTTDFFFFQKFSDIQAVAMVGKNEQKKKKNSFQYFFFLHPVTSPSSSLADPVPWSPSSGRKMFTRNKPQMGADSVKFGQRGLDEWFSFGPGHTFISKYSIKTNIRAWAEWNTPQMQGNLYLSHKKCWSVSSEHFIGSGISLSSVLILHIGNKTNCPFKAHLYLQIGLKRLSSLATGLHSVLVAAEGGRWEGKQKQYWQKNTGTLETRRWGRRSAAT